MVEDADRSNNLTREKREKIDRQAHDVVHDVIHCEMVVIQSNATLAIERTCIKDGYLASLLDFLHEV